MDKVAERRRKEAVRELKTHPGFKVILELLEEHKKLAVAKLQSAVRNKEDGRYEIGIIDTWEKAARVLREL